MSSLNRATIIGNVGKDPEIRSMQSGDRVASLSVATSERWKDKRTGEQREETEWHRVSVFNQHLVDVIERYVTKGTKVFLSGAIKTRKWVDKDGADRYSTEIVLKPFNGEIILLSAKDSNGSSSRPDPDDNYDRGTGEIPARQLDDLADDLPWERIGAGQ